MDDGALQPHAQVTNTTTAESSPLSCGLPGESFTSGFPAAVRPTGLTVT